MDEKTIEFFEEHIPEMAQAAVTEAYWAALASGHKVLEVEGNNLVETSPDGTKKVIESLPPRSACGTFSSNFPKRVCSTLFLNPLE